MKIYVVQKGDTLAEIARKHGMTIEELQKMNSGLTDDTSLVQGLKIKVSIGKKPLKKMEKSIRSGNHTQPLITSQNLEPKISIQSPAANPRMTDVTAPSMTQPIKPAAAAGASAGNPPESNDFSKVIYPKESHYPMLEESQAAAAYGTMPAAQTADYPFLTQGMVDIHHPYQPDPSPAPVSYQHQSAGVTMPGMNPALSQANTGSPLPLYYGASGYGYPMPTGNRANVKTPAARASAAYPLPAPANPYPYTSAPAAAPSSSAPAYNGKWGGGSAAEKRSENVTKAAPAAGPGPAVNFSSAGKPGVMKSTGAVQSGGKTAASPVGTAPSAYPYPYSQPAAMPAQPSPCGCNEPVYPQTYSAAASFPAGAAYPQPAYYSSMSRQQGIPVYMGNQPPIPSSGQRWDNYPAESLQPLQPDFPIDDTNEE